MSNSVFAFIADQLSGIFDDDRYPVPLQIRGAKIKVQKLASFTLQHPDDITDWVAKFNSLISDVPLRDTLLVRALQAYLPRGAEALTLLDIIRWQGFAADPEVPGQQVVTAFSIHWSQIQDLLKPPGDISGNPWLQLLLQKIQSVDDLHALQACLALWLSAPEELVRLDYRREGVTALPIVGGTPPSLSLQDLIDLINSPLSVGLPVTLPLSLPDLVQAAQTPGSQGKLSIVGPDTFVISPAMPIRRLNEIGLELMLQSVAAWLGKSQDLGAGWLASLSTTATGTKTFRVLLRDGAVTTQGSQGDFEFRVTKSPPAGQPALTIGRLDGTHLEIGALRLACQFRIASPPFRFSVRLDRAAVVLAPKDLSLGLLGGALPLPGNLRFEIDVEVGYVTGSGWQFNYDTDKVPGVQVTVPSGLNLGGGGSGLSIDTVTVRMEVRPDATALRPVLRTEIAATSRLGPVQIQMQGAGVSLGLRGSGEAIRPVPPTGLGLTIDAGPATGGGFLAKTGSGEYVGALQLKILGIGAFAYGIYKALPGGDPSIVALVGIHFPPPGIQLSWGFALSGIGGLIGINRRADTDLLRDRLQAGTSGNVLFNSNPVENAPLLLNDMRAFFPDEARVFLVGPTLQLNWLLLVQLDVGVFIELPGPRKIFIAGSARVVVGGSPELSLIYLRLDFIGGIDLTKQLFFFDACLVHSHVMQIFHVTGGAAVRLAYGPNGYFLMSIGGFHPSYNPGPLELPTVPRVGACLSQNLGVKAWLKLEMYVALTPGTFQLGAAVEAGLDIGPLSAHGWFQFDALVQFEPFYFEARIQAGFDIEVEGVSLYGVQVTGVLSGPGPLVLRARASVKVLFVRISGNVTLRLGSDSPGHPLPIDDVVGLLLPELKKPANLRAAGNDAQVRFHPRPGTLPADTALVTPAGGLIWEQKQVPFNLDITRFNGVDLNGVHRLKVTGASSSSPERDWFSVGSYLKLTDAEALNTGRFSEHESGYRFGGGTISGPALPCPVTINLRKVPGLIPFFNLGVALYATPGLREMQRELHGFVAPRAGPAMVTLHDVPWKVVDGDGSTTSGNQTAVQAFALNRHAGESGGMAVCECDLPVDLTDVV